MSVRVMARVWENSRHRTGSLLLLLAIADYADDDGVAFPSIEALKRKSRMTERNVYYALARLKASGELEILEPDQPRTTTTYRVIPPAGEQLVIIGQKRKGPKPPRRDPAKIAPLQNLTLDPAKNDRSPLKKSTGGTTSEPPVEPGTRAAAPNFEKVPTPAEEERAFVKEAAALWMKARSKPGLERFTDAAAIRNMKLSAARALSAGCRLEDVQAGVATHAGDPKSNPWYLDEWAREARGIREQAESTARKMHERALEDETYRKRQGHGPRPISELLN